MSNTTLNTLASGKDVIPSLAERYPQMYLEPTEEGRSEYRDIVLGGSDAPTHSLDHFAGSDSDTFELLSLPCGIVRIARLSERKDFEMCLSILANRCTVKEIPSTQGASILDGLISWKNIRDHEQEFLKDHTEEEWEAEFRAFTSDKKNYTDALILLSRSPYSGVDASVFSCSEAEWLEHSDTIRMYHELTHFVSRRLFHEEIDPVFDELAADAVGIFAAYGQYDRTMALRVLGIENGDFIGGRLSNYVKDKRLPAMKDAVQEVSLLAERIELLFGDHSTESWYEMVIHLEENHRKLLEGITLPEPE
ncbi:MAG: hypothetical protein J6S26_02740 [Solobacterium sp.]|nr:hypothetical protein [Solobacterium sp.]